MKRKDHKIIIIEGIEIEEHNKDNKVGIYNII